MKVYIVTKEREVIVKDVYPDEQFMFFRRGAYRLDSDKVKLHFTKENFNPDAELIFIEGNPFAYSFEGCIDESKEKGVLEEEVLRNAIENLIKLPRESAVNKLRSFFNFIAEPKTLIALTVLFFFSVILIGLLK